MSPQKSKLKELQAVTSQLNSKSDDLNQSFQTLEAKLAEMKLGVSVWLPRLIAIGKNYIPLEEGQEDHPVRRFDACEVGYAKAGGEWHICIQRIRMCEDPDTPGEWEQDCVLDEAMPVTQAPKVIGAEAAGLLDDLIDAVIKRAQKYIENIEKAEEAVRTANDMGVPAELP